MSVEGTAAGNLASPRKPEADARRDGLASRCGRKRSRIGREPPSADVANCTPGTVVDIGYLGDLSIYKLRIRDGSLVRAAVANAGRRPSAAIGFGRAGLAELGRPTPRSC